MRVDAPPLLPIFRSRLQGQILALVLGAPERNWTVEELSERTGQPYQTVASETRRLQGAGFLSVRIVGRTKLLSADVTNPLVRPLTELVLMSFGPPLVISEEFAGLTGLERVFLYRSWAARFEGEQGPPPNDIDVLVLGTPDRDVSTTPRNELSSGSAER